MKNKNFQIKSIYETIKKQGEFLQTKSVELIALFNEINKDASTLIEAHKAKCFLFLNHGQDQFDVTFCTVDANKDIKQFFDKYQVELNDGDSFGLEYLDYDTDFEIEYYPTEDYFSVRRSEHLASLFYDWFLECLWNSELIHVDIPLIYSATSDYDELYDMKDGMKEYHNFDFLDE